MLPGMQGFLVAATTTAAGQGPDLLGPRECGSLSKEAMEDSWRDTVYSDYYTGMIIVETTITIIISFTAGIYMRETS